MGISSAMAYEGSTALPSAAAPQFPQKETTYSGPALSRDGLKLQSLKDLKHQAPKCISANICQYLQYVFYIYLSKSIPHLWMYERNFLPKMLLDVIPICQLGIALPCRSAMQHQGTDTPALRAAPAPTHIHFISNLKNGGRPTNPFTSLLQFWYQVVGISTIEILQLVILHVSRSHLQRQSFGLQNT